MLISMRTLIGKFRLLIMASLLALFGYITTLLALFGPCYNGCTVSSFFTDVIEGFPISLLTLLFLGCAGLLGLLALYIFLSIFTNKLKIKKWIYILLTVIVSPMLLLALYGLVFDFGDAVIYGPIALIASGIVALIWYPIWRKREDV